MTSLGDEFFVVYSHAGEKVDVYDATTFNSKPSISVPGLTHARGLTSCAANNCLYATSCEYNTVHRVDLSTHDVESWHVEWYPTGVHVNSLKNVIVLCGRGDSLEEYTTHGQQIREIRLKSAGLTNSWFVIQLSNSQFALSHPNRVCVVDADGQVVLSYGDTTTAGSAAGQLDNPQGIVPVTNGCILVADSGNNRVMILNPTFSWARELLVPGCGQLYKPGKLWLDESCGRMYVSSWNGVLVFDNVRNVHAY